MNISIEAQGELSDNDRTVIADGLGAYNREQGFIWQREPLSLVARDAEGRIVGGLLAENNFGWLFIAGLWVEKEHRNSGIGTRLVRQAEDEARRRGYEGVFLDTYSFQARPFYERLGFSVFGELAGCPIGGVRYSLSKRLEPAPPKPS